MRFLMVVWQWCIRQFLWFVLIVLILAVGSLAREQLKTIDTDDLELDVLQQARVELEGFSSITSAEVTKQTQRLVKASLEAQRVQLEKTNREIQQLEGKRSPCDLVSLILESSGVDCGKDKLRLEVLKQQRAYLAALLRVTTAAQDRRDGKTWLELLRRKHENAFKDVKRNKSKQEAIRRDNFLPDVNPFSNGYKKLRQLKDEYSDLLRRNNAASEAYKKQKTSLDAFRMPVPPPEFAVSQQPINRTLGDLKKAIDIRIKKQNDSWLRMLIKRMRDFSPTAFWIVAASVVLPPLINLLFYFGLAPLASRLAPICIIPNRKAPAIPEPSPSAVSISVDVGPDEELLVQPHFLQTTSQSAKKHTKWLLNPRIPFASIASGMFALTCIRPEGATPTPVRVSSQKNAFEKVGVIEVPTGAAMIVQPRALVGIVKPTRTPVDISRHWRLSSLHAWLTWQLRYLAFHGPCKLVLKGCRGICSEEPQPNEPRLINQAATLGFSANLDYRTTRCETFISYFRGQEDLFNDLFAGGPGRFVYEEVPTIGGKVGVTGRGLQGIVDAVLNAFGI